MNDHMPIVHGQLFVCLLNHRLADFFGTWRWNDGTETDFGFNDTTGDATTGVYPWMDYQPSSSSDQCGHFYGTNDWNDIGCSYPCYPICAGDGTGDVLFSRIEDPLNVSDGGWSQGQLVTYIDIYGTYTFSL